jgi:hypothetical protein
MMGCLKQTGIIVSDTTMLSSGILLKDTIVTSSGVRLNDGSMASDAALQAMSTQVNGDDTNSMD